MEKQRPISQLWKITKRLRLKNAGELPIVNLLEKKSFYTIRWYRDLTQHRYLYNILICFIKTGNLLTSGIYWI